MSLLKKLFGGNDTPAVKTPTDGAPPPPGGADVVKAFDQFGRPIQIPRESWRTQVLLPNLASKRADPDALYGLIANALRDGFAADALEPARHLAATDPQPARGANLLGVVLLQLRQPAEAKTVLEQAIAAQGEDAHLLLNLAKACSVLGETARRDEVLWRAIEREPNQGAAVLWYAALAKEQSGAEGEAQAFERVAALPGSWLAQLWVARAALAAKDSDRAVSLYREVFTRVEPLPTEALMQISGDLGNAGHLDQLLDVCSPRFDPAIHGMQVGNNLIKANLDLGRTDEARRLVEQLYARRRPDWQETLLGWERRIQEAESHDGPVDAPVALGIMAVEQPLWALGTLGFDALLPPKEAQAPRLTFVCGTAETGAKDTQVRLQRTDAIGQVTRTFPLYLAEELYLATSAATRTLIPFVEPNGVALVGAPWTLEALDKVCSGSDVVVLLHIDARAAPWQLKFSACLWATKAAIAGWTIPLTLENPLPAVQSALDRLITELRGLPGLNIQPVGSTPQWALREHAGIYTAVLEQALLVALNSSATSGKPAIWGERSMLDRLLQVAITTPANPRPRLLLLNTVQKEGRRRPDIVREYLDKLSLLQQRHPLPAGAAADLATAALDRIRESVKAN